MTQTISRMYGNLAQASRAADELRAKGYKNVFMVAGSSPSGGDAAAEAAAGDYDRIVKSITDGFVWKPHAMVYAKGVSKGGSLVTVHAPFGTARNAQTILDRHSPIESGLVEPVEPTCAWDEAVPVSSALQMPVLLKTQRPMEVICNVPSVVKASNGLSKWLGFPLLAKEIAPFSKMIGMPLLSKSATPLSSRFGLPLLSKSRAR